MGVCSNLGIIGGILILTGIISTGSAISGGVHVYKHFNDYKCGNLNYGLLVGLISLVLLIFNLLMYAISCVKKISLIIPSLLIIGSIVYNGYLYNKLTNDCITYYKDTEKNLWDFYMYYVITLLIVVILIIIGFIHNCCKQK